MTSIENTYSLESWRDGFQSGYDQAINEMLFWATESRRKTIPIKWVHARVRQFDEPSHKDLDKYVNKQVLQALGSLKDSMPQEQNLTTKYGYNSDEKKYGYRLAVNDLRETLDQVATKYRGGE